MSVRTWLVAWPFVWSCGSDPAVATCPDGYQELPDLDNCYRAEVTLETWVNARTACAAEGAFLAIPDTGYEALVVTTVVGNAGSTNPAWVGISDLDAENMFVTVLGAPATFLPWNPIEPNGGSNANCVRINNDAQYLDDTCTELHEYVCEIEP